MTTLADDLRAASHLWYMKPQLLTAAADELDRLEALVERDHSLIGRLERTLRADHHSAGG